MVEGRAQKMPKSWPKITSFGNFALCKRPRVVCFVVFLWLWRLRKHEGHTYTGVEATYPPNAGSRESRKVTDIRLNISLND